MRKNRLCGETVTLYHPDPAAQTICRRVLRGVSWQQGRREKPEAAGQYGADYTLDPGDRVLLGEGPGVAWADWPGFVPAAVAGLAVVAYVLPLRLRGRVHHVEAGAWWNASGTGAHSLTR
ncbi:hypothetical protein [Gemmiger sp.]|uniref:hypothetical protein n=1 Tax=Gemmiger sp. TaxID=2049027 RepID=UPI003A949134